MPRPRGWAVGTPTSLGGWGACGRWVFGGESGTARRQGADRTPRGARNNPPHTCTSPTRNQIRGSRRSGLREAPAGLRSTLRRTPPTSTSPGGPCPPPPVQGALAHLHRPTGLPPTPARSLNRVQFINRRTPQAQGTEAGFVVGVGREHEHADLGQHGTDVAADSDTVAVGQADVENARSPAWGVLMVRSFAERPLLFGACVPPGNRGVGTFAVRVVDRRTMPSGSGTGSMAGVGSEGTPPGGACDG